ncbi:MAG: hypothetical protein KGH67_03790 [Candidatus Micrarchaeota archaeon]|nr:hypothetical protein [Candidatus Micrarchaeota archaeon]MDE1859624.1 hypothetical protein [Candidatus Micrarchaeota archaeon]
MLLDVFSKIFGRSKANAKVSISSVNLKFMGNPHSLSGFVVSTDTFDYEIPFQNKMGSDLLPDNLKGPKVTIKNITVSEPFALLEVTPKLPADVEYMSKMVFKLKIAAPKVAYDGPITINFGNAPIDNIAIDIRKIRLSYKGKSTDVEESRMAATMLKSQVFKKEIQLYQIASLNDTISNIEVNGPFELVSVTPKLPITADKKDSYLVSLFIKAPQSSYAGDLEINMS